MSGAQAEPLAEHERFMVRALELAEKGRGRTAPNPLVGCVIVKDDEIVAEGWHQRAGEPHAEIHALEVAGERAREATVYVTLEPCNHHGRTPPCTEALIEAGVRRVVIAATDPNPKAAGGLKRLQEANIEVVVGVMRDEAEQQNEVFRTVHLKGRPFVLYKAAMTLDGKIATRSGQSRWITGEAARNLVHLWRSEMDALAVGVNTVLLDDPLLTCRLEHGRSPVKVIFDSVARTPIEAKLFGEGPRGQAARIIVFVTQKAAASRIKALEARGAEVLEIPAVRGRADVGVALGFLKDRELSSLLLEGGGTLAWSFFEQGAVDKVAIFIGPKLIGGSGASPLGGLGITHMDDAIQLRDLHTEFIAQDLLVTGRVGYARGHPRQAGAKEEAL